MKLRPSPSSTAKNRSPRLMQLELLEERTVPAGLIDFQGGMVFDVGGNPASVVAADVNGDARTDVVTANGGSGEIAVLLNSGDGAFLAPRVYAAGENPTSVIAADLDGDGYVDLVTMNPDSDSITVLLNTGNGDFEQSATYTAGDSPIAIAAAHVNDDEHLDLVVANQASATISVIINQGNGAFDPQVIDALNTMPMAMTLADVDGDGKRDVVTANRNARTFSILRSLGDGAFDDESWYPSANPWRFVTSGDVDGDGDVDLAFVSDTRTVDILLNQGNGTFAQGTSYSGMGAAFFLAMADVDNDGSIDMIASGLNGSVSVRYNQGDGGFGEPITFPIAAGAYSGATSIAVADLNGDGAVDLIVSREDVSAITVLRNWGAGAFQSASNYLLPGSPSAIVSADLDDDGYVDLIAAQYGSVVVMRNAGDGTFELPSFSDTGYSGGSMAAADLDNDGVLDLALIRESPLRFPWSDPPDELYINLMRGREDGSFEQVAIVSTGVNPIHIVAADFNLDGYTDLATANSGSLSVSIIINNGDGIFSTSEYLVGGIRESMVAGDIDGDGDYDLVFADNDAGEIRALRNSGNATFEMETIFTAGAPLSSIVLADLNDDGFLDIAASFLSSAAILVLRNRGIGTFDLAEMYSVAVSPTSITAADVDGDRAVDLATVSRVSGTVSILRNRGDGMFESRVDFVPGFDPWYLIAADVNGDEAVDLIFSNPGSRSVSVLINSTEQADWIRLRSLDVLTEGGEVRLYGEADFGMADDAIAYAWDIAGYENYIDLEGSTPTLSWAQALLLGIFDGDGSTRTIRLKATNSLGQTKFAETTLRLLNASPTAHLVGSLDLKVGIEAEFALYASDSSFVDQDSDFSFRIDWDGDGITDQTVVGPSGTTVRHTFRRGGEYSTRLVAVDKDGAASAVSTSNVVVSGWLMEPDLDEPELTNLLWWGTRYGDAFVLLDRQADAVIFAQWNSWEDVATIDVAQGVTGLVFAFGQGGVDYLLAASEFDGPVHFFGGDGADVLVGALGGGLLEGGGGNDVLLAQSASDADIPFAGASFTLMGGAGEDLLVAGRVQFAEYPSDLPKIAAEWTSGVSFIRRLAHLSGAPGGLNEGVFLIFGSTVLGNDAVDILFGGENADWLFYDIGVDLTDEG